MTLDDALDALAPATLTVVKSRPELRHTFGPVFFDGVADDPEATRKAVWSDGYIGRAVVRESDGAAVGRLVELGQWPFPQAVSVGLPGGPSRVLLKAGTAYAGITWTAEAFPLARGGRFATGLTVGGRPVSVFDVEA